MAFANELPLKNVYTPLHETGNDPVRLALKDFLFSIVAEQALLDGDFSTVKSLVVKTNPLFRWPCASLKGKERIWFLEQIRIVDISVRRSRCVNVN